MTSVSGFEAVFAILSKAAIKKMNGMKTLPAYILKSFLGSKDGQQAHLIKSFHSDLDSVLFKLTSEKDAEPLAKAKKAP